MVNLKSAREIKPKNLNNEKISLISSKISSLNSRNQSNTKYIKINKIIKQINSKEKIKKQQKQIININNINIKDDNKIILKAERKMINNLRKYNISIESYNKKIITDIIYDEKKHIVSEFKNYLLWDEMSDFLKRFYYIHESKNRLPKINNYYEKYTLFSPVYFSLEDIIKIMLKNVKRKKKYLEMIEENEDNIIDNKKENENKEFKRIINPSDITQTMTLNTYQSNLTNTFSSFHLENENSSNDLGILINKINNDCISFFEDNEIISTKNKNNSHEIFIDNLEISKSLFNLNDYEIEKDNNNIIKNSFENNLNDNNKTKLPKIGKILEVKKLNLQNINNISIPLHSKNIIEKYNKTQNSDRQKINHFFSTIQNLTNEKSSNIKRKINSKQKNNYLNNLLFSQKFLTTTSREINYKKNNNDNNIKDKKNKTIESILKNIQFPKQISSRIKKNKTQNKKITQKKKTNLVIQTNSNKNTINSKIHLSQNKKDNKNISNIDKIQKKKNYTNIITTPINYITNHDITSSIFNINLNLNLGHALTNPNKSNKKNNNQGNFNYIVKNNNKNKYSNNIRNIYGNPYIPINIINSNIFKIKKLNIEKKKDIENKRKDGKISYDLNTEENNVHITIQKQLNNNNNIYNNINNNNNQPSLNININCNNNICEKKFSRNEKKNYSILSNMQSININKGKNLVIQLMESKTCQKKIKSYSKKLDKENIIMNNFLHETSMSLGKIKKKLNVQINKKYPLTSRNDKDIPYELISKMLKKN